MIRLLGDTLVVLSAILCWVFVVAYHRLTGGAWRRSEAGRHLMAMKTVFGLVLTLAVVRLAGLDSVWFALLRTITFLGVPIVLIWRLAMLVRAQRPQVEVEEEQR